MTDPEATTPERRPRRDEGSALLIVLGAMTAVMLFVSVALSAALATNGTARRSTDWNQAFAAAQAGIDDYLAHLNSDDSYWRTTDCTDVALRRPWTAPSPPCTWTGSTERGWLPVPGAARAQFHYDVDASSTPVDGAIDLVSTGRVGKVTRSLQVTLRRGGFGEFLYYTVYETKDPADYAATSDVVQDGIDCARYWWNSPRRDSDCENINFVGGDSINGPMHTNDTMLIGQSDASGNGPRFKGTVTTSVPGCVPSNPSTCYHSSVSNPRPRFDRGIAHRDEILLPESIGDLRQYVDPTKTQPAGCLYTGPTRIVLNAAVGSATPTMTVWSNWSNVSQLNLNCAGAKRSPTQLTPWPRIVNVPANSLIMVQNTPSDQTSPAPAGGQCAAGSIGDGLPQEADFNRTLPEFDCGNGTVYVEGTLKGRLTVSADNNIVVTGDLKYQGGQTGTDALGLIASNSVQIYHPVTTVCTQRDRSNNCTAYGPGSDMNRPSGSPFRDPVVNAAILTLEHSFEVQQYNVGNDLGTIHLFGTIAQRFRGIVGTGRGDTGYLKDYNYDTRMRYAPPPYFLDPVRSSWGQKTFGEVAPLYGS